MRESGLNGVITNKQKFILRKSLVYQRKAQTNYTLDIYNREKTITISIGAFSGGSSSKKLRSVRNVYVFWLLLLLLWSVPYLKRDCNRLAAIVIGRCGLAPLILCVLMCFYAAIYEKQRVFYNLPTFAKCINAT